MCQLLCNAAALGSYTPNGFRYLGARQFCKLRQLPLPPLLRHHEHRTRHVAPPTHAAKKVVPSQPHVAFLHSVHRFRPLESNYRPTMLGIRRSQ